MTSKLGLDVLAAELGTLDGWKRRSDGHAIEKTYEFPTFAAAFGFMTEIAIAAEKADHHPEWTNVYNRVEVTLTTHEAGGVTARDLALARYMDRVAEGR